MGNLLSEYRRRHKSDFIWGMTDGVCFFNKNRRPFAICLLSDPTKALSNCDRCWQRPTKFICEIICSSFNKKTNNINIVRHEHINADEDLSKFMKKIDAGLVPYLARDHRDIETWLWNYFVQFKPFKKPIIFDEYVKNQDKRQSGISKALDQMLWCAINYPSIYSLFYEDLYTHILVGRNYLLYK
jgi:hypothetical protein